jgi:hypothetical protein
LLLRQPICKQALPSVEKTINRVSRVFSTSSAFPSACKCHDLTGYKEEFRHSREMRKKIGVIDGTLTSGRLFVDPSLFHFYTYQSMD